MNRKLYAPLALLVVAGVAQAQTYRSDSGVSGDSIGFTNGGDLAWMQEFTVIGGQNQIVSISTCFDSPVNPNASLITAGMPFRVFVWKGTPRGTGADTPTLLASANGTVAAGSIKTDVFQTVNISATITGTSNFFIGASIVHAAGAFAAPLQTTGTGPFPILGKAWVAGNPSGAFDPNNLNAGVGLFKTTETPFGDGNWLIRANAVPEPMTLTAMGLALGSLLLRRRKKA